MAEIIGDFFGNLFNPQRPIVAPSPVTEDADFADFAGAPEPSPVSFLSAQSSETPGTTASAVPSIAPTLALRPYTKWYRVWERTTIADFYSELFIIPFLFTIVLLHLWGTRKNKRKAKSWMVAHAPVLQQEFASVGFSGRKTDSSPLVLDMATIDLPKSIMKTKAACEYVTYATGRQNVAFVDIKLTLAKRYNPMARFAENALGFFFESMPAPKERMEATSYVFDGRETELVGSVAANEQKRDKSSSSFDGFVWAVVHKDAMQFWRNGRYDLSLTTTKDHAKLPDWATVMSESAEITDVILKDDLIKAIKDAGETLEALVISDQPVDKPQKLDEAISRKRITLITRLPSGTDPATYSTTVPIFTQFLRLPDLLAASAHFRPEVMRRVRATREEQLKLIKKVDEGEKAEDRRLKVEKDKRQEREARLKGMSPDEQKKFLEKERTTEMRRGQKKRTVKA